MKKILIGMGLLCAGLFAKAQNGLESIVVEKYYVSNAADAAGSVGVLPTGSVTYRVWADLLPGYNFQALYGEPGHTMLVQTTTTFFNNEDYGTTTPTISTVNVRKNSALIDSYFSVGGAATGRVAVFKTEDTDGSPGNAQNILQNNDPTTTGPINIGTTTSLLANDGMIPGSPVAVTFVGIPNTGNGDLGVFDGLSQVGGLFTTSGGSVAALGGATGPTAANRVLVGQFTTDGVFHFELNVQIGTPTGGTENYVSSNPVGSEITIPSLTGTFGAANSLPSVSITSPANGASFMTGTVVTINATASDPDGTVSSVEFFVDGNSIGTDNASPYTINWTSTAGSHNLTARATDNNGGQTTSAVINISVVSDPPPTVSITSPANGANFPAGAVITIDATASDNVSVASVEFFVDGNSIGLDNTSPYSATYNSTPGPHSLTARATDNVGGQTTSAAVSISVGANTPPTVSITAPANGVQVVAPAAVNITANANDPDGTLQYVQFYVNGNSIGIDGTSPYSISWTSVIGSASITARAVDNLFGQTTSAPVNITVLDPNAAPYKVANTSATCVATLLCVPVEAVVAVANVIGYDVIMHYDKTKVQPTGVVSVYNNLINATYVDVATSSDTANGNLYISLFFNATAPPTARFTGAGNVFCAEFSKLASFDGVDTAVFSVTSLQESYFTGVVSQGVDDGEYSSFQDTSFKSTVTFWLDNSPIRYNIGNPTQYLITNIYGNSSSCNNRSTTAVQPDMGGAFDYDIQNGVDIEFVRNIAPGTNVQPVINGFDAFLTRKVLINDIGFIPSIYQIIAMDINMDGVVSAGDLSQVNQRTVLLIPEFKQAWNYDSAGTSNGQPSKDWLFIDGNTLTNNLSYRISTTYPADDGIGYSKFSVPVVPFCLTVPVSGTPSCPIMGLETYKGILVGDVNGNFATAGSGGTFRDASGKVIFDLTKAVSANGYIDVPVSIISNEEINALDFSLQYNETKFTYNTVVDHTSYLQELSHLNSDDRTIRFTSSSMQNYQMGKSLVSVRFISASGKIEESDLNSIQGYLNGEEADVEVISARNAADLNNYKVVALFPNPATSVVNVIVAEAATIELLDINSKEIMLQTTTGENEKKEIGVENLPNGIYLMKIYNENFVSFMKIVVNR